MGLQLGLSSTMCNLSGGSLYSVISHPLASAMILAEAKQLKVRGLVSTETVVLCWWGSSDEGLALGMSALETLYGGQLTFSYQLC